MMSASSGATPPYRPIRTPRASSASLDPEDRKEMSWIRKALLTMDMAPLSKRLPQPGPRQGCALLTERRAARKSVGGHSFVRTRRDAHACGATDALFAPACMGVGSLMRNRAPQ